MSRFIRDSTGFVFLGLGMVVLTLGMPASEVRNAVQLVGLLVAVTAALAGASQFRGGQMLIVAALALTISSCAPDPNLQATADKTRIETAQKALDQEQARAQQKAEFDRKQALWEAAFAQTVNALNFIIKIGGLSIALSLGYVIVFTARGVGFAAEGLGHAVANAAMVRSNLIALDRATRQYPLFLQHTGNGLFTLTDSNTGQVLQLDVRKAADRQMIAAANAVRLAGTVAEAARLSSDPTGVAMIGTDPAMAGAREEMPDGSLLEVGVAHMRQLAMTGGGNE